jgi:hypothetical protein
MDGGTENLAAECLARLAILRRRGIVCISSDLDPWSACEHTGKMAPANDAESLVVRSNPPLLFVSSPLYNFPL